MFLHMRTYHTPQMLENFEIPQNRTYSFLVPFPFQNRSRVFFSKCPTLLCSNIFKCRFFIILIRLGRWGISRFANIKKWGHSRKKHSIDFEMGKGSKLNRFYHGAFQDFRAYAAYDMPSRAKNSSHAIWGISRNRYDIFKPTHHSVGPLHFQQ